MATHFPASTSSSLEPRRTTAGSCSSTASPTQHNSGIYRRGSFDRGAVRYELIELLACGGMASVFLAAQRHGANLDRLVAVKTPHPRLDDLREGASSQSQALALLREARIGASVRSPNVVQTLDLASDGERALLVLEYVDGVSLAALAPSHDDATATVPAAVTAGIVRSVLAGLDAVHETRDAEGHRVGLVHRDVTPGNVLLGVDGHARIADFGLARATAPEASRFDRTRIEGTARYLAPEQARGEQLDRRVDVFAAGALLFELLTGTRLYDGASAAEVVEIAAQGASHAAAALEARRVPAPLRAVCLRALASRRDDRFATARHFARALDAAALGTVGVAPHDTIGRFIGARFRTRIERQRQRIAEWRAGLDTVSAA